MSNVSNVSNVQQVKKFTRLRLLKECSQSIGDALLAYKLVMLSFCKNRNKKCVCFHKFLKKTVNYVQIILTRLTGEKRSLDFFVKTKEIKNYKIEISAAKNNHN